MLEKYHCRVNEWGQHDLSLVGEVNRRTVEVCGKKESWPRVG